MDGTVVAVSSKTIVKSAGYLGKLLNIYKKARFFPGQKNSMGTLLLCCTQTIQDNPFDESQRWPDDAEQCFRWKSFWVRDFLLQMLKSGKLVILDSWSLGQYGECMEVQISKSISHSHLIGLGVGR